MNANTTYNMPPFENGSFNGTTSDFIQGIQLGYFDIPPEIAAIEVQLNGLPSLPAVPSIELPACAPLLTTRVWREDTLKMENRFYPYLWSPGRPPTFLQAYDYDNIFDPSLAGGLTQRIKMDVGHLALTASRKLVLFYETKDRVAADAGPSLWQGITRKNNTFTFMPTPEALQVSGPSPSYPKSTVFAEIHTKESYPQKKNTNPVAPSGFKKKSKAASRGKNAHARPSATVRERQALGTTPAPPMSTFESYAPTTDQTNEATCEWYGWFGDESQAVQGSYSDVLAFESCYNQPQSHVINPANLTDEEFADLLCFAEKNCTYTYSDSILQTLNFHFSWNP